MMYTFLMLVCLCGAGVDFMIGSIANRISESQILGLAIVMPMVAFTGLLVNNSTLPWFFRWV